jgi:hypothetical protein
MHPDILRGHFARHGHVVSLTVHCVSGAPEFTDAPVRDAPGAPPTRFVASVCFAHARAAARARLLDGRVLRGAGGHPCTVVVRTRVDELPEVRALWAELKREAGAGAQEQERAPRGCVSALVCGVQFARC